MHRRELFKMLGLAVLVTPLAAVAGEAEAKGTFLPDGNVHLESYWLGWDDARSTATPAYVGSAGGCAQPFDAIQPWQNTYTGVDPRLYIEGWRDDNV
jgi:hypothetical protein